MPNIIQYRNKCIGCGICYEMMPGNWRMSKKDGKATLLKSVLKKETSVATLDPGLINIAQKVATACPVRIIKVNQ